LIVQEREKAAAMPRGEDCFGHVSHVAFMAPGSRGWPGAASSSQIDAALAHAGDLPRLEFLGLAGLPVTDAGLAHPVGMTSLRELRLERSMVTDAGVRRLPPRSRMGAGSSPPLGRPALRSSSEPAPRRVALDPWARRRTASPALEAPHGACAGRPPCFPSIFRPSPPPGL
jgi:hypothetical protein